MSTNEIHVADIGTDLRVRLLKQDGTALDTEAATTREIWLQPPTGDRRDKTALAEPNGWVHYETVAGDLDQAGWWKLQAFVVTADGQWHSDIVNFRVYPNLAAPAA